MQREVVGRDPHVVRRCGPADEAGHRNEAQREQRASWRHDREHTVVRAERIPRPCEKTPHRRCAIVVAKGPAHSRSLVMTFTKLLPAALLLVCAGCPADDDGETTGATATESSTDPTTSSTTATTTTASTSTETATTTAGSSEESTGTTDTGPSDSSESESGTGHHDGS